MIKVLIADDHPVIHEGLKKIFDKVPYIKVAGEAYNAVETLNKIKHHDYDLLILDISMPDRNGLDILKEIKGIRPQLRVLILSIHREEQYAVRALKAGAAGYMTKQSVPDELLRAIQRISQGGKYITSSLAEKLALYIQNETKDLKHNALTNREFEIMRLIAKGTARKEIAQELSLSVNTVSTYRARIMSKMKMKNIVEVIHYALENNLID